MSDKKQLVYNEDTIYFIKNENNKQTLGLITNEDQFNHSVWVINNLYREDINQVSLHKFIKSTGENENLGPVGDFVRGKGDN